MPESNCRTCTYYMHGDPSTCNALHVPSIDKIDCSDWQLRADIRQIESSAIERLTEEQARSVIEGLSAIELQLRDAERFRAAMRPTHRPSIHLSDLQRVLNTNPSPPRDESDRLQIERIGLVPQYWRTLPPTPRSNVDRFELTPIETPDGLKWSFQGTVILD